LLVTLVVFFGFWLICIAMSLRPKASTTTDAQTEQKPQE
jgi:hypothetical protein